MKETKRNMEEKMKIWDQIAGLNPTGQMSFKNGVLKPLGNIAQIVSPQQLQSQNLDKTATNTPVSQKVTVEGFENSFSFKQKDDDIKIRRMVYGLIALISTLLFILNIKKM
jgi:hypothetical protein